MSKVPVKEIQALLQHSGNLDFKVTENVTDRTQLYENEIS